MIRPVIPQQFLGQVSRCNAVTRDPLFRLIWVTDKEEQLLARAKGMLEGLAKKMRA